VNVVSCPSCKSDQCVETNIDDGAICLSCGHSFRQRRTSPTPPAPGVTEEMVARGALRLHCLLEEWWSGETPPSFNTVAQEAQDRCLTWSRDILTAALSSRQAEPTLCPKCSTLYRPGERHACVDAAAMGTTDE
jgi:hypothetical protein